MDMDDRHLVVVPLNPTPAEREGKSKAEIQKEREYIRDHVVNRPNLELVRDEEAMKLVRELGSDLSINAFACNFRLANGEINQDVVESNYLNTRIYDRLSVTKIEDNIFDKPLFIMSTCMEQKVYGECCNNLKKRLGLVGDQDLDILVNCVMSPFPTVANFSQSQLGRSKDVRTSSERPFSAISATRVCFKGLPLDTQTEDPTGRADGRCAKQSYWRLFFVYCAGPDTFASGDVCRLVIIVLSSNDVHVVCAGYNPHSYRSNVE
ncbi:pyridoxal-dependent decarboxylase domain protein, putative, partial [Rhizoctonia solani AG-3 Rhs1AP]